MPLEITTTPRERIRDLVTPQAKDPDAPLDPSGRFVRSQRVDDRPRSRHPAVTVKFGVRGRDLAGAVSAAQAKVRDLIPKGYRVEWSGEFQQMQEGETRLMFIIPLSLLLITVLLYLAFHSIIDALVVLSNVLALSLGGIWALLLTGTRTSASRRPSVSRRSSAWRSWTGCCSCRRSISCAAKGCRCARRSCAGPNARVRPVMMTALTAIFGLLPAAHFDQDRRSDAKAAGHRRGGEHDRDAVPDALPDAGALQLLRPPRNQTARGRSGALAWMAGELDPTNRVEFGRLTVNRLKSAACRDRQGGKASQQRHHAAAIAAQNNSRSGRRPGATPIIVDVPR